MWKSIHRKKIAAQIFNCGRATLAFAFFASVLLGNQFGNNSFAEDYPILDGRTYNGLYYPNVDILEWGDPLHLEFQVYDKKRPIEVTGKTVKSGDRHVFVFTIDFPERGERLCRRVLAPKDFVDGKPVYLTTETGDNEMNNFIFSHKPIKGKSSQIVAGVDDCVEKKPVAKAGEAPVVSEPERPPAFVVEDPVPKARVPASVSSGAKTPAPVKSPSGRAPASSGPARNPKPLGPPYNSADLTGELGGAASSDDSSQLPSGSANAPRSIQSNQPQVDKSEIYESGYGPRSD